MSNTHAEGRQPFLRIARVSKLFGMFQALKDVSIDIYEGEFICFLGPSGCGKTTLLRAIAGLDIQTSGRIHQGGVDISALPPSQRDFGIVFQSYALFPNLTVARNIGYGLENYDIGGKYRTHDDAHPECVLPDKGELPGYGEFSGPGQLARLLVDSGQLEACFMQQLMTYAVGRELRPEEAAAKDALLASFKADGYGLRELLTRYVADERFALRQEEVTP